MKSKRNNNFLRKIAKFKLPYVIAEIGINHNGDFSLAKKMILSAKKSGANCVKFQSFKAEEYISCYAPKATYQKKYKKSQLELIKSCELKIETLRKLKKFARQINIDFLCTPFEIKSLKELVKIGVPAIKISSDNLNNIPFLIEVSKTKLPVLLSTGMANLNEIKMALGVIAFGYIGDERTPSIKSFEEAFNSIEGKNLLKEKVHLLHCTSEYPAPLEEVNLNAIQFLKKEFGLNVGYSDHTLGIDVALGAVALGAEVIEKHFSLSRDSEGPDHKASLEPDELSLMISKIRQMEIALGKEEKIRTPSEMKNLKIARKSIVAEKTINPGDQFSTFNISIKRPGIGMQPISFWDLLSKKSSKKYKPGDLIDE